MQLIPAMKSLRFPLALVIAGASLFALRGLAFSPDPTETSAQQAAEMRVKLDHAASEIRTRLNMSSALEILPEEENEENIPAKLLEEGWIVEASVEQVEAALKAAVATPETTDDIPAARLAHRASCRFFFKDTDLTTVPGGR